MSPICDGTRLILGSIAALGGIIFAGMTGALTNDIKHLYRRLFRRARNRASPRGTATETPGLSKILAWALLILGFSATVFLGSYVAAVPSKTCVNLVISELVCNPEGDELEGELVTVENLSGRKIDLNKWTLCDYQNKHCYEFKAIAIQPHSRLTLWTKAGEDSSTDLYFGEPQPIWTNAADSAYLYDVKKQLIYQSPCP